MAIQKLNESTKLTDSTLPKDRLGSKQFATYVDVLSEGIISGFPSAIDEGHTEGSANYNRAALKDVFLNNTQVLSQGANSSNPNDPDYNFQDVGFDCRFGTSNQTYIKGINDIETENQVNTKVEKGTPVTRTITNTNVNAVRVTVGFPRLEKYNDDGDVEGAEVRLKIDVKKAGGSFSTKIDDTIKGRSSSTYLRDYRINISAPFPVEIRVERETANSTDTKLLNEFNWTTYTEIIDQQFAYEHTAHSALRFDSEIFPQVPSRMWRVRGIKVKIPNNATLRSDGSLSYSGSWNGSFSTNEVATTCPSWILYNTLINQRYGFGSHITEAQLDKFSFYSVSTYNNELINDGQGGTHARFAFNGSIQKQTDAYKLINSLCSAMRVMPYWGSGGGLYISQDSPKSSSYVFTLANTLEGGFSYEGSSAKTRATQINVSYFDSITRTIDWEEVSDSAMQNKWGIISKNVKGYGITSRGQASRLGKWMLYTLTRECEVVNFKATLETCILAVGDVIEVADPLRSGLRRGGRITAAYSNTITVDDSSSQTDLDSTNNPVLSVILPDGSVESKAVTSINGADITVDSAFSTTPQYNSVWVLSNDTAETSTWRIISIFEEENNVYQISALTYNASKFNYIEDGAALTTRTISILNEIPDPPTNLQATEQFYVENNNAKVKTIVSWTPQNGITKYKLQYRKDSGNWTIVELKRSDYEITDTSEGTYQFRVYAINAIRKPSSTPSELTYIATGKTAVPSDLANLSFESVSSNTVRLTWTKPTEEDVIHGGKIHIRHNALTDGTATWNNSVDLVNAVPGNSSDVIIPKLQGEVLLKVADDGGRFSTNATSIIIQNPIQKHNILLVKNQREDQISPTPFTGNKTNTEYDSGLDALQLTSSGGDINSTGSYQFVDTLDLGAQFPLDISRWFVTRAIRPSDLMDNWPDVDARGDWDGAVIDDVNSKLYVRTTNDNPSSSPTWGSWNELKNGTFSGRGFQFKTDLTSADTTENILIDQLGYKATLEQRTEQSTGIVASGAGAKTVSFSKNFWTGTAALGGSTSAYLPSVTFVVHNMSSGDYIDMGTVTGSQFTVTFKNSSNAAVDRNFTWSAVGYGRAV